MTDFIPPRDALKGWKSIADYFGRDTSTVMRWAGQRGLPVRRMPGEGRSSVYALPAELAAWLARDRDGEQAPDASSPAVAEPVPAAAAPKSQPVVRRPGWRRLLAAGLAAAIAVGVAVVAWHRPAPAPRVPGFRDAATERAYLAATYDVSLRTPAALARARDEFGAIIARDPTAAAAYSGLAETYLLLREYSAFPAVEAYRKAAAAARAAIALAPDLMAAHRALAFVAFWNDHDLATARREFARARALDPRDAQTWHWYATALSANGEEAAAFDAIQAARRLAPDSTPIAADYGLIAYLAGRREEGLAALHQVAAVAPAHMSTHQYLADLALARGDGATYLAEAAIACRLRDDGAGGSALAPDRAAFVGGGEKALLASIAARLATQASATEGHYALARIEALQGRKADALAALRRAVAAHEPGMAALPGDIALHDLAGDSDFEGLKPRGLLAEPTGGLADL